MSLWIKMKPIQKKRGGGFKRPKKIVTNYYSKNPLPLKVSECAIIIRQGIFFGFVWHNVSCLDCHAYFCVQSLGLCIIRQAFDWKSIFTFEVERKNILVLDLKKKWKGKKHNNDIWIEIWGMWKKGNVMEGRRRGAGRAKLM